MSEITDAAVLAALRTAVQKSGSPTAFARRAGVSAGYVIDIQRGFRPAGPKILAALGLKKAVIQVEGGTDASRR